MSNACRRGNQVSPIEIGIPLVDVSLRRVWVTSSPRDLMTQEQPIRAFVLARHKICQTESPLCQDGDIHGWQPHGSLLQIWSCRFECRFL